MVIRRGETRDEGGAISVSASVSLSGNLGNPDGGEEGIVKSTSGR